VNCTCLGAHRDRCARCRGDLDEPRRRIADNALRAAINRGVSDPEWSALVARYDVRAFERLLAPGQGGA
jgi:hypothetical protein